MAINLAWWESNYYRYTGWSYEKGPLQLHQVYLRYQGMLHCNSTFEIDDSAIHKEGFTYSATYPTGLSTGNTVTLSPTEPLCFKRYSYGQGYHFAVGFGQCFGQNWINVICEEPDTPLSDACDSMLERAPEHAQCMKRAPFWSFTLSGLHFADSSPSINPDPADFLRHVEVLKDMRNQT